MVFKDLDELDIQLVWLIMFIKDKYINSVNRKRIAIVTSYSRLGQWRGIMRYGQLAGWICQRHDRESIDRLRAWNPDGILFQIDEFDDVLLNFVRNASVPMVGLRALSEKEDSSPLVLPDLEAIARDVTNHFISSNYRRICYLGPFSDAKANCNNTHVRGIYQIARKFDISIDYIFPDRPESWEILGLKYEVPSSTCWNRFWEFGPALVEYLLRKAEPVALFSAFMEPAMELMEMIDERDIAIPDRIGLVAQTEDALTGTVTKIPLTCIVPNYESQGFESASLLDRILNGEILPRTYRQFVPASEFVLRQSSNQVVSSDPLVSEMVNHIRKNALSFGYTPDRLAEAFGVSLRLVQLRFNKALGKGVAEIIREHRTRHAVELIRNTKVSLQEIVSMCGFSDHHHLARAVRNSFGVTPSSLRLKRLGK